MATSQQVDLIVSTARAKGLDPYAVLSVAQQEGLGGGIGDNGTSFGPFQLHVGGAFPVNVNGASTSGWSTQQRHDWAWSQAGIEYALNRIASVAYGLRGSAAIHAIVSRFERPANPGREIAAANDTYRRYGRLVEAYETPDVRTPGVRQTIYNADGSSSSKDGPNVVDGGVLGTLSTVGDLIGKLSSRDFLIRSGQVVGGFALLLIGLVLLARQVALAFDVPDPTAAGGAVGAAAKLATKI